MSPPLGTFPANLMPASANTMRLTSPQELGSESLRHKFCNNAARLGLVTFVLCGRPVQNSVALNSRPKNKIEIAMSSSLRQLAKSPMLFVIKFCLPFCSTLEWTSIALSMQLARFRIVFEPLCPAGLSPWLEIRI